MSAQSPSPVSKPLLSNRNYNLLKASATVVLPALGALYFALAQIWGLPRAEEVVGSIAALNTFVGVLLGISTRSYNKSDSKFDGDFELQHTDDGMIPKLVLTSDERLEQMKQLNLRIVNK